MLKPICMRKVINQTKKKIILAGLGSVGKFYLRSLIKYNYNFIVFDPHIKKKNFYFNKYKDLARELNHNEYTHAIICSQADTHFYNFNFFLKYGVKNFLIEKPMGNNLLNLYNIKKKELDSNLRIISNYKWSVVKLNDQIKKIEKKFKMGEMYNFISYAGACCLATGGVHIIDFLNNYFLFKKNKFNLYAKLNLKKINPRNKKLYNIGGFINFNKDNLSATIHYDNNSRIAPVNIMIYKNHKIEFNLYGDYKIYEIKKNIWNEKITRYDYPSLIKKGSFYQNNIIDNITKLFVEKNYSINDIDRGISCFELMLAALISHKKKSSLKLNNINNLIKKNKMFDRNIPIT